MSNSAPRPTSRQAGLALDRSLVEQLEPATLHGAVKDLLAPLDARARRILERRFGMSDGRPKTLQEIGDLETITRERVRQLEQAAVRSLQGSGPASEVQKALLGLLHAMGRVAREETLVSSLGLSKDKDRAALRLLLVSLPGVTEARETQRTHRHWTLASEARKDGGDSPEAPSLEHVSEAAEQVLTRARKVLPDARFLSEVQQTLGGSFPEIALRSLLASAKRISRTAFGEWGLTAWREVTPRGVGDKAYVVVKRAEKPLHFLAITDAVNAAGFDERRAHPQTVHNELIRDERFVLVGRGLYGLKEWGHEPGTVAEVAVRLLARSVRPLSKRDLVEAVLKERLVKRNTVILALQNRQLFRVLPDGTYELAASALGIEAPGETRGGQTGALNNTEPGPLP